MANRYVYNEDETLRIAKHQCDLCSYKTEADYGCIKLSHAPQDVLENKVKCKEFKPKGVSYPWGK